MRKIFIVFFLLLFLTGAVATTHAQSFDYVENAVYVYNFIKYTSWPQKKATIQVGIVGSTQLEGELRNLLSKKTNSGTVYVIRSISPGESKNMDVVVVAESASDQLRSIDKQTAGLPILIITEKENMGRIGACISFFIDDDNDYKTGYQLSIRNCKARGLSVNEQIQNNAVLTR